MMSGMPFVRSTIERPVVESTNNLAKSLLLEGAHELPMLVWAERQTLGRGRGSNQWWSDEGSLTFTVGLDPVAHNLRIDQEPRLALTMALAVIEAVKNLGLAAPGIGIRWPNDIEVKGRKLCGILPERVDVEGGHRLLIGVGINVLNHLNCAPPAIQRMATSLSTFQPQPLSPPVLPRLLEGILICFECELNLLAREDTTLADRWNHLNLLYGQIVRVSLGPRIIEGRVLEIDFQGALCIHDGQQLHRLFGGQVLRNRA
jgi:BirA family biotin operon repressor/biotin-[acetyl-CoA-carboxylase] ligase